MNTAASKPLFILTVKEWFHAKSWFVLLGAIIFAPIAANVFVPIEDHDRLVSPAMAQALYMVVFFIASLYAPTMAAEIGRSQTARNHRIFWKAQGMSDSVYFLTLLVATLVPLFAFCVIAGGAIALTSGAFVPKVSLLQAISLTFFAATVSLPIAIGLSQRVASSIATFIAVAVNVLGFYGPAILEYARYHSRLSDYAQRVIELLYALIPHLRIGDQAERVAFAWPPISAPSYFAAALYLVGWAVVTSFIGFFFFRVRSSRWT